MDGFVFFLSLISCCFILQTIGLVALFFLVYSGIFDFFEGLRVWDALSLFFDRYRSVVISETYSRFVFEIELDLYCIIVALHSFSQRQKLYSSVGGWDFRSFFTTSSPLNSDVTFFPSFISPIIAP